MARPKTSNQWLKEHFADPYVKEAHKRGFRSRAAFKLLEIQEKDTLLKPGMTVIDLGAAPGSWSQIAVDIVGEKGKVFALDILPMDSIIDVDIIEGDFREESVLNQLEQALEGRKVDLVISDIAPNMSGYDSVDQPRAMYLVELALDFAKQDLRPGGNFCCKVFQGAGFEPYFKDMKATFNKVITRKPKSSRGRSREVYLIGVGITKSKS